MASVRAMSRDVIRRVCTGVSFSSLGARVAVTTTSSRLKLEATVSTGASAVGAVAIPAAAIANTMFIADTCI